VKWVNTASSRKSKTQTKEVPSSIERMDERIRAATERRVTMARRCWIDGSTSISPRCRRKHPQRPLPLDRHLEHENTRQIRSHGMKRQH